MTTTPTAATNTFLACTCCLLMFYSTVPTTNTFVSAMVSPSSPSSSSLKIRVCQGSSCLGKCRGAFNPLTSFENLLRVGDDDGDNNNANKAPATTTIELEESFCMNQCKRGPNVRLINADNGNVLTFDSTVMNDTESNRKAFQGVTNEIRVKHLWGIANKVAEGSMVGTVTEKGSVDKLNDIMPRKKWSGDRSNTKHVQTAMLHLEFRNVAELSLVIGLWVSHWHCKFSSASQIKKKIEMKLVRFGICSVRRNAHAIVRRNRSSIIHFNATEPKTILTINMYGTVRYPTTLCSICGDSFVSCNPLLYCHSDHVFTNLNH